MESNKKELAVPAWQFLNYQNWVKIALCSMLADPGQSLCELCCKTGENLGKWGRAKIGRYIGVDAVESNVQATQKVWESRGGSKFVDASFHVSDPGTMVLPEMVGTVDVITCLSLHRFFVKEKIARQFLRNVSSHLADNGYFFGWLPDSTELWRRREKALLAERGGEAGSVNVDGKLFSLSFAPSAFSSYFGSTCDCSIRGLPLQHFTLVHFGTLMDLAQECGLELVEKVNFEEFYGDYRDAFRKPLEESRVLDKNGKIAPEQLELMRLYCTFVFKKVGPPMDDPNEKASAKREAPAPEENMEMDDDSLQLSPMSPMD